MVKHLLAIIGLVFAGLAVWPAWTDSAPPAPVGTPGLAASPAPRARAIEIEHAAAPLACPEAAQRPLAHSLLGILGLAPAGRQPGAQPCACAAASASPRRAGPGGIQGWSR